MGKRVKSGPDSVSGSHPVNGCGAKTKAGTPCKRPAGSGTGHVGTGRCKLHGGASPQAELSGALALARAESVVMGVALDVEPHEAILGCIRIAWAEVKYATARVAELEAEEAAAPVVTTHTRPRKFFGGSEVAEDDEDSPVPVEERVGWVTEVKHGPPALNVWIETRHRAMDRAVTYSKIALAAGVEERRVRVAERAGEMMAELIRGVLTDLGIPLGDPKTREVVTRHLALIEGGAG